MSDRSTPLRVLVVTNMYPTPQTPAFGAFVETEVNAIRRLDGGAAAVVELVFVNGREHLAAYLRAPYQIREIVRRRNIDVVHAHYGLTGFVAAFHDVPLVVTFHGDDLWGTRTPSGGISTKSRVARWFSYSVASRADAIICHSEELRSALPRAADRARAHVIPMGVDTNRFTPGKREAARQRLGQPTDQRLVLFPVSAMQPVKRLDLAQAAVNLVRGRGMNARLWIVTGVSPAAMPDYYRAADCLLVTSDRESGPVVVKEALCCDLPVVSVDVGDAARWLDLARGCRVVSRDPPDIADGLWQVLQESRAINGAHVRSEISADRIATGIVDVYRSVLKAL